jgi:hypothetical protein
VNEQGPPGTPRIPYNWVLDPLDRLVFDGFFVLREGGSILPWTSGPNSGFEVWEWTGYPAGDQRDVWGNSVEGLRIDGQSPTTPGFFDLCPYHRLRSYFNGTATMNQQAAHAVTLVTATGPNPTAVVLGCPGGKVRVLRPGVWRPDDATHHALGTVETAPVDYGFGGSALAVRHEVVGATEKLVIWFGTVVHPTPRPASYTPAGALQDHEVATGAVVRMEWGPSTGFVNTLPPVPLSPTSANPRGAYGVVGLLETDLVAWPGRELLVATMSGDLIVLDAATLVERWRTHVDGAIGFYNSMLAADLDNDSVAEIYVAGSKGLWRFLQPGE